MAFSLSKGGGGWRKAFKIFLVIYGPPSEIEPSSVKWQKLNIDGKIITMFYSSASRITKISVVLSMRYIMLLHGMKVADF